MSIDTMNRSLFVVVILLTVSTSAFGTVLHTGHEPDASWAGRPDNGVIVRWGGNASGVMIGRDGWSASPYFITTRHQFGGPGTSVYVNGTSYTIESITNHDTADLRVVKLTTDLSEFAMLNTSTSESSDGDIVIGGYGRGRGDDKLTGGTTWGYDWAVGATVLNDTLRWGTNQIDGTGTAVDTDNNFTSSLLTGDFDGWGDNGYTTYEAIPAEYDSGGGWFQKKADGKWYVVAMTYGVEHGEEEYAQFRDSTTPADPDPDGFYGVRVSEYRDWINAQIPEPATLVLLGLGGMSLLARRRRRRS